MGVFNDKKREFAFVDNAQVAQSSSVMWMSLSALALLCLLKFLKKLNLDKLFARIYFNFPSLFSTI